MEVAVRIAVLVAVVAEVAIKAGLAIMWDAEVVERNWSPLCRVGILPLEVEVLLDEGGKEMRSMEFADYMKRKMNTVNKRLVFVIGGPYGFAPKVYAAAHEKMSLSRMTFSHQMVRLIFVEQLYRAMSILNGSPYHHE